MPRFGFPPPTRRTILKTFRLAPGEHAALKAKPRAVGLGLSSYVRQVALGRRLRARPRFVDRSALAQLSRLASNLHQLQRVALASGSAVAPELARTLEELAETVDTLISSFELKV